MKLKFFVGAILSLAILVSTIVFSGGNMIVFVDVPTYLIIFLIPAAIAFASWPLREIGKAFSAPFDAAATKVELSKSRLFFESLRKWVLVAALAGTMVGLVCILAFYSSGDQERLARNCAVMLLCVTNALAFFLVLPLPLESIAKRRLAELEQ
jgi:flagellar motor component MotA